MCTFSDAPGSFLLGRDSNNLLYEIIVVIPIAVMVMMYYCSVLLPPLTSVLKAM